MIDRFKSLLDQLHLSPSEFADKIGVQRSSISHILSGRNKPSIDFLEKILNVFPETDVNYLITGKISSTRSINNVFPVEKSEPQAPEPSTDFNETGKKIPVAVSLQPVEKIIIVYSNNTFRILDPS